jgi:hypothetical protein
MQISVEFPAIKDIIFVWQTEENGTQLLPVIA